MTDNRSIFDQNAALLRELNNRVHLEYRRNRGGPRHVAAAEEFRNRFDSLAFPGGWESALQKFKQSDTPTIELSIRFLEADPWFFRSGYIKQEIIRHLKHLPLSSFQRLRIGQIVLRHVDHGTRGRLARHLPRLALAADFEVLWRELNFRAHPPGNNVADRASHVIEILRSVKAETTFKS